MFVAGVVTAGAAVAAPRASAPRRPALRGGRARAPLAAWGVGEGRRRLRSPPSLSSPRDFVAPTASAPVGSNTSNPTCELTTRRLCVFRNGWRAGHPSSEIRVDVGPCPLDFTSLNRIQPKNPSSAHLPSLGRPSLLPLSVSLGYPSPSSCGHDEGLWRETEVSCA